MKNRTIGDEMLELEPILDRMVIKHGLQVGDILNLIFGQLQVHNPGAFEEYLDGSKPKMYYGPEK